MIEKDKKDRKDKIQKIKFKIQKTKDKEKIQNTQNVVEHV